VIETSESAPGRPVEGGDDPTPADLPVSAALGRFLVLVAVFVCAACGLVYELVLIALADHLLSEDVTDTSVVLSLLVFAMGLGSLAAKRLRARASVNFGLIEALLALCGGGSVTAYYLCYVLLGTARPVLLWTVLICLSLIVGALIGAEMPLLMALIQRIRTQDAGHAVADLSAADYVGALLGGLAFPFLLLPLFGQLHAALLTGTVNALAGGVIVFWLFRGDLSRRARLRLYAINAAVVGLLLTVAVFAGPLECAFHDHTDHGPAEVGQHDEPPHRHA